MTALIPVLQQLKCSESVVVCGLSTRRGRRFGSSGMVVSRLERMVSSGVSAADYGRHCWRVFQIAMRDCVLGFVSRRVRRPLIASEPRPRRPDVAQGGTFHFSTLPLTSTFPPYFHPHFASPMFYLCSSTTHYASLINFPSHFPLYLPPYLPHSCSFSETYPTTSIGVKEWKAPPRPRPHRGVRRRAERSRTYLDQKTPEEEDGEDAQSDNEGQGRGPQDGEDAEVKKEMTRKREGRTRKKHPSLPPCTVSSNGPSSIRAAYAQQQVRCASTISLDTASISRASQARTDGRDNYASSHTTTISGMNVLQIIHESAATTADAYLHSAPSAPPHYSAADQECCLVRRTPCTSGVRVVRPRPACPSVGQQPKSTHPTAYEIDEDVDFYTSHTSSSHFRITFEPVEKVRQDRRGDLPQDRPQTRKTISLDQVVDCAAVRAAMLFWICAPLPRY
ncbi:hypothetical protein C8R43DRAFT_1123061 [Mycena crocata]|nr:hypothetical protein C8R43DRAFT_1123061 [Mycena crocata]